MLDTTIVTQLPLWGLARNLRKNGPKPPNLHTLVQLPELLPAWVTESPTILRSLELLAPLDWAHLPERDLQHNWGQVTIPNATLAAAELIRLNEAIPSSRLLHR